MKKFFEKQQFHFRHILLFQNNLEKEVRLFSDALNEFLLHFSAFTLLCIQTLHPNHMRNYNGLRECLYLKYFHADFFACKGVHNNVVILGYASKVLNYVDRVNF